MKILSLSTLIYQIRSYVTLSSRKGVFTWKSFCKNTKNYIKFFFLKNIYENYVNVDVFSILNYKIYYNTQFNTLQDNAIAV